MRSDLLDNDSNQIKNLIYIIRGKQVMLDSDLAKLYQVETKQLTRQMKRNRDRFPEDFCFQLTRFEFENLRCQNGTSSQNYGGRRYNPYVYTEAGISMLSSVLRSETAIKVSVTIIRTFVEMRKFLLNNQELFSRLDRVELKQLTYQEKTDKRFEQVFDYIAEKKEVSQKIFFDGQIYDAYSLFVKIIRKASECIILIDNYVDTITLDILSKKQDNVTLDIYTSKKSKLNHTEIEKFNAQYKGLSVRNVERFHDRFIILDKKICYHIGASIKDAGNKSFAINRVEDNCTIEHILSRL
ncbi:MAG: DNA-binding protein [Clostridiales bacterium]|nr:MAG: DNA-binding protein [Clostridiales bacterium]